MNSDTSKKLHFVMTNDQALREAIVELSRVFHVVPSAVPDTQPPLLLVEVDNDYPELLGEVQQIVATCDAAAAELYDAV